MSSAVFRSILLVLNVCITTGSGPEIVCDVGWSSFQGNCYKYFYSEVTWQKARTSCQSYGADLAVVKNYAENNFIFSLASRQSIWIGLTDMAEEGVFKWIETGMNSDYRTLDDEDPQLEGCPEDLTVGTNQGKNYVDARWTEPIASDNVGIKTETQSHSPGDRFRLVDGKPTVYTVRYWVQDYRANEAECLFNVTVIDDEAPELQCPEETSNYYKTFYGFIHASTDEGSPNGTITWTPSVARDNSEIPPIITNFPNKPGDVYPMKLFPPYTTTITATDRSGNSRECVLHFAVVDTEGPVVTCPTYSNNMISSSSKSSWRVLTDPGSSSARLYWYPANATDNSGTVVSVTSNYNPGDEFLASNVSHQITYTAIDEDNNVGNCSFFITVEDMESPSVECPSHLHSESVFLSWNITISDNVGVFHWMANDSRVVPSHSTPSDTKITFQQNGTFVIGTSFVEYLVTDISGNTRKCLIVITVEDLKRPSIICPSNFSNYYDYVFGFHRLVADYGRSYATVTWPSPEVNDDSQDPVTWESFPYKSGDKFPIRQFPPYTVQFTATDKSGNNISCYVYFTIVDIEPPIINCPKNITNYHDTFFGIVRAAIDPFSNTSTVTWDHPTVSDNSVRHVKVTSSYQSGESFPPRFYPPYEVEFTAEDESGNKNTCKLYFLVTDKNPPEIQCPSFVKADSQTSMNSSLVRWQIVVSDVEPISLIKVNNSAVMPSRLEPFKRKVNFTATALLPAGITYIEYAFEDSSSNAAFCTFQVEVLEYVSTFTSPFTQIVNKQTVKSDVTTASSTLPNAIYTAYLYTDEVTDRSTSPLVSPTSLLSQISLSTSLSMTSSSSVYSPLLSITPSTSSSSSSSSSIFASSSSSSSSPSSSSSSSSLSSSFITASSITTPSQYYGLASSSPLLSSLSSPAPSSLSSSSSSSASSSSSSLSTTQRSSSLPSTLLSSKSVTDEVVNTLQHTNMITEDANFKHRTQITNQKNTVHQSTDPQLTDVLRPTDPQPTELTDRQSFNQHTTAKPFLSRQYTDHIDKRSRNQHRTVHQETTKQFSTDLTLSTKQQSTDQTIHPQTQNTLLNKLLTAETVSSQRFTSSVDNTVSSSRNVNSDHTLYKSLSTAANELSISDNLYRMTEDTIYNFTTASSLKIATTRIVIEAKINNTNSNGTDSATLVILCLCLFGGLLFFISLFIIIKKKMIDKSTVNQHYSDANDFDSDRTSVNICDLEPLNKDPSVTRTGDGHSNCAYISDVKDSKL
ncbi:hyalin-like [Anneissia japonica]|uniref:hyalin-like n=1 Tax=Anneissia japonica TaxID=1529436 RepID=UPI001425B810|nr:hyalin-like [Anneissia japonica]